jgi:hypothetical protein
VKPTKPERLNTVELALLANGMTECSECRSWVFATRDAELFHMRRCRG